jgi:hypothetical protein
MATRLWTFLTAAGPLLESATIPGTTDAGDAVLSLVEILAEEGPTSDRLEPLVQQLDSLLDAINAPLGKLVRSPRPLMEVGPGLLAFYCATSGREPTLTQVVALISQAAYLESFCDLVRRNPRLAQLLTANDSTPRAKTITIEVKALSRFELTDPEARRASVAFEQSALAEAFNRALNARLEQIGMPAKLANRVAAAVAKNTNRYIKAAIAATGQPLPAQNPSDRP